MARAHGSLTALIECAAETCQRDFHTEQCGLSEGLFYIRVPHLNVAHILPSPFHVGNQISLHASLVHCEFSTGAVQSHGTVAEDGIPYGKEAPGYQMTQSLFFSYTVFMSHFVVN